MLKLTDFSAIIFDLDGLVLDTESTYFTAWQAAAKTLGYELNDEFCLSLSGLNYHAVEQKLLAHCGNGFDLQAFNQRSGTLWREHVSVHGIKVKPGFFDVMGFIKQRQIPFCLATNSRRQFALECLQLAGLADVFALIVCRDDVRLGKPSPDIFLAAADLLQTDIKHCLVLEDSHTGIVAAASAGAFSVYVPSTRPVKPATVALCDLMVDDLSQLL